MDSVTHWNCLAEVYGNRTHLGHYSRPTLDLKSRSPTRSYPLPRLFSYNPQSVSTTKARSVQTISLIIRNLLIFVKDLGD